MTFRPTGTFYPTRAAPIPHSPEGSWENFPPITRRLSVRTRLALLRFFRPSALWKMGATNTGFTFPGCAALSGFLNLSALQLPLVPFAALFHTAYTPGLLPSRGFPSLESVAPLDARSPLDLASRFQYRFPRQAAFRNPFPARWPSGVFPSGKSVLPRSVLPSRRSRSSPGFGPLQGSPRLRDGHAFTHLPLTHFDAGSPHPKARLTFARCPRVSLNATCGLSLHHPEG
jgi:hypothetical protein